MSKVTIIIGLPGSGKTTMLFYLHKQNEYYSHQDWSSLGKFEDYTGYESLAQQIKNNKNIILDGSSFCNHKFLCEAEYHLNLHFPNVEITRCYFENNPEASKANMLYRENLKGNYWSEVNGELIFHGDHWVEKGPNLNRRSYEVLIDSINNLSKDYIIPNRYTPIQIQVQDNKFYKGWRALIR